MSDTAFMVLVHLIAAAPPTVAAVAAVITALHAKRNTQQIMVTVNGRMEKMQAELDDARRALAQKESL